MSHFEVLEESAADKTLVRQDLSGLLLSGRRPLFSPIQTNLSSLLEIRIMSITISQFVILKYSMLDQPNPEKNKSWKTNPNKFTNFG